MFFWCVGTLILFTRSHIVCQSSFSRKAFIFLWHWIKRDEMSSYDAAVPISHFFLPGICLSIFVVWDHDSPWICFCSPFLLTWPSPDSPNRKLILNWKTRSDWTCGVVQSEWGDKFLKLKLSGWMRFGARSVPTRPVHSTNDNQEMLIAFREYISTIKITWTLRENSPCKHYLQLSKYFRGTPPRGKYKENKSKLLLIPTIPIS